MTKTNLDFLAETDVQVAEVLQQELQRQRDHLELIASENFTSAAVMAAQGSVLTNKYAEGLPGKRYYGGCEFVDRVEQLAIDRIKTLFGAAHANVQPPFRRSSQFRRLSDATRTWRHHHGDGIYPTAAILLMAPRLTFPASGSKSSSMA